jgi:hypothetical protein
MALVMVAGLAALPPVLAQPARVTHYEPSQRSKTVLESCLKDEVMNGPNCVKKCQPDFRLDLTSRPPLCIATRPNARYEPIVRPTLPPRERAGKGAAGY